jgi:hypothetical protein
MTVFKPSKQFMKNLRMLKLMPPGQYYEAAMLIEAFEDIKETIEEEIANNQAELDKINGKTETE